MWFLVIIYLIVHVIPGSYSLSDTYSLVVIRFGNNSTYSSSLVVCVLVVCDMIVFSLVLVVRVCGIALVA